MNSQSDLPGEYTSETDSTSAVDEILRDLTAVNNKLDYLSAQMSSVAETTTGTQNISSILSKIGTFVRSNSPDQHECDGTNCKLSDGYQRTLSERDELASTVGNLQDRLDTMNKEVNRKQGEIRRYRKQINKLRRIALDKAGGEKVSEDEIIQAFLRVQRKTRALARSPALNYNQVPVLDHNAPQHVREFYYGDGEWNSFEQKDRKLHVRGGIFLILHRAILDQNRFGIEGYKSGDRRPTGPIAEALSELEALAKEKRVSTPVLVNWRLATIECVEALDFHEGLSELVVDALLVLFEPILDRGDLMQATEMLRAQALELCKDTVKLTLLMRKSPDGYRCEAFMDKVRNMEKLTMARHGSWCDPQAVHGGKNIEGGDNIAYLLFGALCKKDAYRRGAEVVLVRAQVVLEKEQV